MKTHSKRRLKKQPSQAPKTKSEKKKKKKKKSKSKKTPAKKWKVKTDDKGRTYYVNTETRKSQWTVPEELRIVD